MSSTIPSAPNTTNAHGNGSPGAAGAGGGVATVPGAALCIPGTVGVPGPDGLVLRENSEYSITLTRHSKNSCCPRH